jgi:hypothetical protein
MDAGKKRFLEERYGAADWPAHGRSRRAQREFSLTGAKLRGWTLMRLRRDEGAEPAEIHSLWRRGEEDNELLAIDVFACASVKAAREQLLAALGNFQSDAIERRSEKNAPGEIAFALGDTMVLFARANLAVLIRNAGPKVVRVGVVARELDAWLERRLEGEEGA